jgi:hypothetical protein
MFKPHVDVVGNEPRTKIPFSENWWQVYKRRIEEYALFAKDSGCDLFCIGNELKGTTGECEKWKDLAKAARDLFDGKILYGANRDEVSEISWWNSVDYIGVSAYYPLRGFKDGLEKLARLFDEHKKKVVLTEIGYCSWEGAHREPHKEPTLNAETGEPDDEAQRVCYQAAVEALSEMKPSSLAGVFWWYWPAYFPKEEENSKERLKQKHGYPPKELAKAIIRNYFRPGGNSPA